MSLGENIKREGEQQSLGILWSSSNKEKENLALRIKLKSDQLRADSIIHQIKGTIKRVVEQADVITESAIGFDAFDTEVNSVSYVNLHLTKDSVEGALKIVCDFCDYNDLILFLNDGKALFIKPKHV